MNLLKKIAKQREIFVFLIIVAIMTVMSFVSPVFMSFGNISALFMALSTEVIIAVGMSNLMVSGGFDMSVGSVLAFSGAVSAMLIKAGWPTFFAVLAGIGVGALAGLFNGLVVAKLKINAFVTTLSSLSLFRGLTLITTRGRNVSYRSASFSAIGQSKWLGIRTPIWYAAILVILGDILLRRSRFFRQNYYIGGNEKAAALSGINVDRMKILNYTIVGLLAGVAGVVVTSRMGAASVTQGVGLELRVITATIIGGASLQGGEGSVFGAFLGSLLMTLITNTLTLMGVDIYWHTFVIGATLLTAVLIDQLGKNRKSKAKEITKET